LGWLLSGPINGAGTNSVDTFTTNLIISGEFGNSSANGDDELKSTLKQFWETESIGIREPEDSSINQLSKSFLKNTKYEDHRYEVSLQWKEEQMDVPTDYNIVTKIKILRNYGWFMTGLLSLTVMGDH
jgi:hypothetical protein